MNDEMSARQTLESWWQMGRSSSDANRLIVKFLEQNYRHAAFLTAADLAQAIGVSQSSMTRFAVMLGFSGYSEWSKEMQAVIRLELSATERLWYAAHPSDDDGDRVLLSEQENLTTLSRILNSERFYEFAKALADAKRVVFVSARASATLLPYAHYFLSKVKPHVEMASAGDPLWDRLGSENPTDTLVVVIAFPRYPRVLVEWAVQMQVKGFKLAVITDRLSSPIIQAAWISLIVPVTSVSLFDSYASPIIVLNLLVRQVAALIPNVSEARLNQLESWDKAQNVYI